MSSAAAVRTIGIAAVLLPLIAWAQLMAQETPVASAPAASAEARASADAVAAEPAILDPTQGRPLILHGGEQFRFLIRLGPGISGQVTLSLRHGRAPGLSVPLEPVGDMAIFQQRYASMTLQVRPDTPAGLYDLLVQSSSRTLESLRTVRVVEDFKERFRFVHLSDMTVGDPSAPAFDERLVEEVNLLAPEFIVTTGNYTAWGRLLDDATTWEGVLEYFARFDAPVYVVCGDLDHEASFTTRITQHALGTFDYGRYHGVLLLNHSQSPMDGAQVEFLRRDLDAPRDAVLTMLIGHSDDPSFLEKLAPRDRLAEYLRSHKVRLLITGGSDDWDHLEYADQLAGLDLCYLRTHQASTALRGRATGVSHYRVIEVDGGQVSYVYPAEDSVTDVDHSIPVGRLRVFREQDGLGSVTLSIQNALNQAFADASVWVTLPKTGSAQPQVAGGRLVQCLDGGESWACRVAVDLPDKGGVKVLVTTGQLPPAPPLQVRYEGESRLIFKPARTAAGLSYYESSQTPTLVLVNDSDQPVKTYPVARLNGSVLPLVQEGGIASWPIEVPASGKTMLALSLTLARFSPGPHLMQIMFLEDPVRRLTVFPVTLRGE